MAAKGFSRELKKQVQEHFENIRESINIREKLLLRQIDVITSQSANTSHTLQDVFFIPEGIEELLSTIRMFGKFDLDNLNFAKDVYANEDYISPSVDHETMYKCLQNKNELVNGNEKEVVDFSSNKMFKDTVNNINESIINITLNEAKELIRKSQPLHVLMLEKELISESSQTEKEKQAIKANITINNCNGIINFKNISNLTINCVKEESLNIENEGSSNQSEKLSSRSGCLGSYPGTISVKNNENNLLSCEFYNKLIAEIKTSLKQDISGDNKPLNEKFSKISTDSSNTNFFSRKFLVKNFENLKMVLENKENDFPPVQIEQWLAEIISETETEPMHNPEILEHSKINMKEMY